MAYKEEREKKKAAENAIRTKAKQLLREHKKKYKCISGSKKKNFKEMLESIPDIKDYSFMFIRKPEDWVSKSFNMERQKIDFISWCLCKYKTPKFLYKVFIYGKKLGLSPIHFNDKHTFINWFILIGQGESFYKNSKHIFTKKEAHLFLNAPEENSIIENIWWSRCRARNFPAKMTSWFCKNNSNLDWRNKWWLEVLDFYSKNLNDLDIGTLQDTLDYLKRIKDLDNSFSLKGRTLGSVIKLSNEWHRLQQAAKFGSHLKWVGIPVESWKFEDKNNGIEWTIEQILNSKDLYREGRKMRHCVYSYVSACAKGETAIFSLKNNLHEHCVTIEVVKNEIVQMRGKFNRLPKTAERNIIHRWATRNRLCFGNWL